MMSHVRFVPCLFTGELGVQTIVSYGPGCRMYDHWAWTSDLRVLRKKSAARPLPYDWAVIEGGLHEDARNPFSASA